VETTGLDPLTDRLCLVQLAVANQPVLLVDVRALDARLLEPVFDGQRALVFHNGVFDLGMLLRTGLDIRGSRMLDTMLNEQVPEASTAHFAADGYYSLAHVARRRLGVELDKAKQTSDWAGVLSTDQQVYAARDAAVLLQLLDKQQSELQTAGLIETERLFGGQTRTAIKWSSPHGVLDLLRQRGHDIENTGAETLAQLGDDQLVPVLLEYREAERRSSTYGIEYVQQHVHPVDGRLHPRYHLMGAGTGRMSCSAPNVQQIPRGQHRSAIVPGPERVLVKADYAHHRNAHRCGYRGRPSADRRVFERRGRARADGVTGARGECGNGREGFPGAPAGQGDQFRVAVRPGGPWAAYQCAEQLRGGLH
jgi:DNA polymerase-1